MNTMLGLLLASIALIGWGRVRVVAGVAVIVLASIVIIQAATEIYPIDGAWRVLINTQVPMSNGDAWTGRLSLSAAIAFACIGIALTLLNRAHTTVMRVLLQLTISFVFVLAIIGLYGHLLGITLLQDRLPYPVFMSLPAAVCLFFLSVGAGLACIHSPWFSEFYNEREDRQIFAAAIAVLILISLATGLAGTWIFSNQFIVFFIESYPEASFDVTPEAQVLYQILYDQVWRVIAVLVAIVAFGSSILTRFVRPVAIRLQRQEMLLAKVLESLPIGVWVIDKNGHILKGNPAGRFIWSGAEYADIEHYDKYKVNWHDTGQPIAVEEWGLTRAIRDGKSSLNEVIEVECFDGKRKALLNSVIPLCDDTGNVTGAVAVNQDITRNLLLAEELRQSREFFKVAFESAAVGIVLCEPQGKFLDINQSFCDIVGYTKDELWSMDFSDFTYPEDLAAYEDGLQRLIRGEIRQLQREKRYVHKQGHPVWVMLNIVLVRNAVEEPLYFIIQILDVSERKRSMQALQRWEDIFKNAEWGVAVSSADGVTVELLNPAFARMHGIKSEDLAGQPFDSVIAPERRSIFQVHMQIASKLGHHVFESLHLRKDGRIFPALVDVTAVNDDNGEVCYQVINVQDMTERKKADAALITSETNLNRAQAVAHIGSWSFDVETDTLTWTAETYRIFGISPNNTLTYQLFLECVHPDDRPMVDRRWKTALQGAPYCVEHRILVEGQVKWVRERAELQIDTNGRLVSGIGTVQDITDTKKTEIELAASRQLLRELAAEDNALREEERKRIAREIHDELGQILTALRMDVSLLRIRFGVHDEALMKTVQGMMVLIDRAIRGVRDVATNLRPAALDMGLVPAIRWLCEEFTAHTGTSCRLRSIAETVTVDEARAVVIFRIVQESLTNVAKHAQASHVVVEIAHRNDNLCVEISDNGKGFDPVTSTNRKSFGLLGMRERAIALGGNITVISTLARGTVVSLLIPQNLNPDS